MFRPELAGNLTLMIQGLVVLFVGADVLILYLWQARRAAFRGGGSERRGDARAASGARAASAGSGIGLSVLAFWLSLPPVEQRTRVVPILVGLSRSAPAPARVRAREAGSAGAPSPPA